MDNILIFAGTTEGRELALFLERHKIHCHVCVATEYGEQLLMEGTYLTIHQGRLDIEGMKELIKEEQIQLVIDATHPYAAIVSENICNACGDTVEYMRIFREIGSEDKGYILVSSTEEAARYLNETKGTVLITTGSKELAAFTVVEDYENRLFARVLPTSEVMESCVSLGFTGKHLICMQGPFSKKMNVAMLEQTRASYMVTKDSGKQGGFEEKLWACQEAGVKMILIGRPTKEEGMSVEEMKKYLCQRLQFPTKCKISLLGIGMGREGQLTREAYGACENAQILFGAGRVLESVKELQKPAKKIYLGQDISAYLKEHPQIERAAVLMSGDVGFYSGAKKFYEECKEYEIEVYSGISSLVYFSGRLKMAWEDVHVCSLHGRSQNLISAIKNNHKVFSLLGSTESVSSICEKLVFYGLTEVDIAVGENLSYEDERITKGKPEFFCGKEFSPLSVMVVENQTPNQIITHGIADEAFLRAKVPMTKGEIRSISLSKLELTKDAVIYDVGAGTGSVSIEMALKAEEGHVYAVEKKQEAVALLKENKRKFAVDNLTVVEGLAPEALEQLPMPTHVFIGGSSGNLKEIMEVCLEKNKQVKFVMNAIALETIGEAIKCIKELPVTEQDIVTVTVAKSKEIGNYHMMMGQNPVTIISCTGGNQICEAPEFS